MRVQICAVGRMRAGPELELIDTYIGRFDSTGRGLGLGPCTIKEVEDRRKTGMPGEAALLSKSIPTGAVTCTLDERGRMITSPEFARLLATWRDQGRSDVTFLIGGADGLDSELRARSDTSISLGKMVWPHMLVRVMLAEQLYRAASILANKPYHRA